MHKDTPNFLIVTLKYLLRIVAQIVPPSIFRNYFYKISGINLGSKVFIGNGVTFIDGFLSGHIVLENGVTISPNATIIAMSYPNASELKSFKRIVKSEKISIGRNTWVGASAIILPGVVIGDSCVIGAGSVVTKDIPVGEIWIGNPARFIRRVN
jgi:acetyltransferase-like isoleucine patch superfamily enzyme